MADPELGAAAGWTPKRFLRFRVAGLVVGLLAGGIPSLALSQGGSFGFEIVLAPIVAFVGGVVMLFLWRFRWLGAGLVIGSAAGALQLVVLMLWLIHPVIDF